MKLHSYPSGLSISLKKKHDWNNYYATPWISTAKEFLETSILETGDFGRRISFIVFVF